MSEKLEKLRNKCTEKQAKFIDLLVEEQEKPESYMNAGFKPKSKRIAQQCASKLLTTNNYVMAYYEAKKVERDRNIERTLNITRTTQLNALNTAKDIARTQKNPSAMVSAIREQNEMMGYHRELASNPEKEAEKAAKLSKEDKKIAHEMAIKRCNDIAGGQHHKLNAG